MFATEQKITLAEAAQFYPIRIHMSGVWRHARRGIRARNGQIIRLEHARAGSRLITSREAIERFFAAVAAGDAEHFAPANIKTASSPAAAARSKAIAQAHAVLDEAGL